MMNRSNQTFPSEAHVEDAFFQVLTNEPQPAFLIGSSQNIDRLVGAYRAAKRAGHMLVIDLYTAFIMDLAQTVSSHIPHFTWPDVKVLARDKVSSRHDRQLKTQPIYCRDFGRRVFQPAHTIPFEQVQHQGSTLLLKVPATLIYDLMQRAGWARATILYSQWEGYLEEKYNPNGFTELQFMATDPAFHFHKIHTSGHATQEDLAPLVDAMRPKTLIPSTQKIRTTSTNSMRLASS